MLGYAGLIPFAGLAVLMWLVNSPVLAVVQFTYAAMIASFLGGVHWAHALQPARNNRTQMMVAMAPTILSFISLGLGLMIGPLFALLAISALIIALYFADQRFLDPALLPEHYMRFRRNLSLAVLFCLILSSASLL